MQCTVAATNMKRRVSPSQARHTLLQLDDPRQPPAPSAADDDTLVFANFNQAPAPPLPPLLSY